MSGLMDMPLSAQVILPAALPANLKWLKAGLDACLDSLDRW